MSSFEDFTLNVIAKDAFALETYTHKDPNHSFMVNAMKLFTFGKWRILFSLFSKWLLKSGIYFLDRGVFSYQENKLGDNILESVLISVLYVNETDFIRSLVHISFNATKDLSLLDQSSSIVLPVSAASLIYFNNFSRITQVEKMFLYLKTLPLYKQLNQVEKSNSSDSNINHAVMCYLRKRVRRLCI